MPIRAASSGCVSPATLRVADRLTVWQTRALILCAGLLLALGQAPFSFPIGVVLGLPILGGLLRRVPDMRAGFMLGWLAGSAYFAGSMFWIVEPFFVEPEVYGWMAPFALIFLSVGLALFWGVGFGWAARYRGRMRLVALVATLTLAEFARAHVFTGFPWGLIGYVWSATPVFQLLAWIGPHGLGMVTVAIGVLPLIAPNRWLKGGILVAALAMVWSVGTLRLPDTPVPLRDVTLRLVQPNAPQRLKWHPDYVASFFQRGLSLSAGYDTPVDVVIWPETALPFAYGEHPRGMEMLHNAVGNAQFIGGIQRPDDLKLFNTLMHLDSAGNIAATYDKHHLVPFGEYVPLAHLAAKIGIYGMAAKDGTGFAAGPGPRIISVPGLPPYLPMICYEAIFPGLAQVKGARPDWLLHITNDAWFGNFSGPYQHLVQSRARAIEQGLPLARAANTGVSAMIDPYGQILQALPLNTDGFADVRLPEPLAATLYSKYGELPWIILALLLVGSAAVARRRTSA